MQCAALLEIQLFSYGACLSTGSCLLGVLYLPKVLFNGVLCGKRWRGLALRAISSLSNQAKTKLSATDVLALEQSNL
jgi:hypothetical protein